jgi:hypothetical protein
VFLFFLWFCLRKKKFRWIAEFTAAIASPAVLFVLYTVSRGSFAEMIQQMFIDIRALYTNFAFPIPIDSLMKPDNWYIFGTPGKPLSWVYLILIAPLGLAGLYHTVMELLRQGDMKPRDYLIGALALAFFAHWAALFTVQVAFIQHYMPFHWIAVAFAAGAFDELLSVTSRNVPLNRVITTGLLTLLVALTVTSINHNISRSTITARDQRVYYEAKWAQIPASEAVFPGMLFRPAVYPQPYGGGLIHFPIALLNRLPDIPTLLETKRPRVVIDEYALTHLPGPAQLYISDHYTRRAGDTEMMVRKP